MSLSSASGEGGAGGRRAAGAMPGGGEFCATGQGTGRWVVVLFLVAASLRVGWVGARFGGDGRAERLDYPDEEAYVLSARSLAAGEGLIDEFGFKATYMPGYPAFIAVFQGLPRPLWWTRLAQAVLAAWVAPATFLVARRFVALCGAPGDGWGLAERDGTWVAVLAGLAAALDPFLLFASGLLLTEALFAASLVTAWLFVLPMAGREVLGVREGAVQAFLAGLGLLAGLMLRPSAAVLLMVTPVLVLLVRRLDRASISFGVVLVAVTLAGLVPWAARNRAVIGEWRWLTTRGGISLYDGLQPGAAGGSDLGHTKAAPEVQGLSEVDWDRYFQQAALREARRDPARVVRLAGRKFLRTWSLMPNEPGHRRGASAWVSVGWMVPLLGLALVGWVWCRRKVACWALLLLPVAAFTGLHMIYVGSVRDRVPEMPLVMVLAAAGVAVVGRLMGWGRRQDKMARP